MLPDSHIRALREYGLRYNRLLERWEGINYFLCDHDLRKLKLWELDQILAGVRDCAVRVRVVGGFFNLRTED